MKEKDKKVVYLVSIIMYPSAGTSTPAGKLSSAEVPLASSFNC